MREIKFRAWDKWAKKVIDSFHLRIDLSGDLYFWQWTEGGGKAHQEETKDRFVLMQYTRLKDKNGKEIYEGDIVKHEEGNLVVEWCEQEVGFRLYNGVIYRQTPEPNISEWDIEIIGNIYENPELVNANK